MCQDSHEKLVGVAVMVVLAMVYHLDVAQLWSGWSGAKQ